jgi:ATP-dependent Lon protease
MTVLPIFPLGRVVLPTELIPLHIFETRYRVLMDHLTGSAGPQPPAGPESAAGPEMGVVLIERGHEVGGGDQRTGAGTVVALVQAQRMADGRWLAVFGGTERFRVARWLDDDPYPRAEIERWPDPPWDAALETALGEAERRVRHAVDLAHRLGEAAVDPGFALSAEPVVASWQLCAAAPLGSFDRQRLLETEPAERLDALAGLAADAAALLAYRLESG